MKILNNTQFYRDAIKYWRFIFKLRDFFYEPMAFELVEPIIIKRLSNRENNVLSIIRKAIYENENSPYLKLFKLAGCEYGDVEKMIRSNGVESALRKLSDQGIYVSLDEFKARKEAIRGSKKLFFRENDFDNPFIARDFEFRTGGSRSAGTRTNYDFDFLKMHLTVYSVLRLAVCKVLDKPIAFWGPIMPGWGPSNALPYLQAKQNLVRWFCPVAGQSFRPSLQSRAATNYLIYMSRILGANFPRPEFVPIDHTSQIAKWLFNTVKTYGQCVFVTTTSLAVRICQAAKEMGIDLSGTTFFIGGEPTTEMKKKEIEMVGATASTLYAFTEGGWVGLGCMDPLTADDLHVLKDSVAVIQREKRFPGLDAAVNAFQFTSLLPTTPKILFNLEIGDYGELTTRKCNCYLGKIGLTDHFYNIRSFDKITSEGVTFLGVDLVRILDEILPSRFGGRSTDYQMVEEEDEYGQTRLSIVVSPSVGIVDEEALIHEIYNEIVRGNEGNRMMGNILAQARALRVIRSHPISTSVGKLLPLHIKKAQ